jgi:hypothetical protein
MIVGHLGIGLTEVAALALLGAMLSSLPPAARSYVLSSHGRSGVFGLAGPHGRAFASARGRKAPVERSRSEVSVASRTTAMTPFNPPQVVRQTALIIRAAHRGGLYGP